jgi:hypothetical protein
MQRSFVKHLLPSAVLAFGLLQGAAALAAELPTFEAASLPATPHQLSVIGAADVKEQSATPTLTRADMPASPHQIAVLTPHRRNAAVTTATTVGAARN